MLVYLSTIGALGRLSTILNYRRTREAALAHLVDFIGTVVPIYNIREAVLV